MDTVEKKFREALSSFGMDRLIGECDRVIVGYSGGADSQTLLKLMTGMLRGSGKRVIAAHLNHMIRGADADRDEEKCAFWAKEIGAGFVSKKVDVPGLSKGSGAGIEETARRARYEFFEELADSFEGKSLVATAHNADDNLETVIFNLMRGAGARGMSGIPPVRDGRYIRPLILCTSREIRDFCDGNSIPYNIDKTNTDSEYKRNYIRSEIIPRLYAITDTPQEAASRMTASLRSDDERLETEAEELYRLFLDGKLSREEASCTHDAVLSRFLRRVYSGITGKSSLDRTHITDIIKGIRAGGSPYHVDLPGNVAFESECGEFRFVSSDSGYPKEDVVPARIEPDGAYFRSGRYAVFLTSTLQDRKDVDGIIYNLSTYRPVDFDKIKGEFFVRGRKEGDSYRFGNMTRKLKKLLSERKIPPSERDSFPVVCDGDGIVWVPGFPLRDELSGTSDAKVYLCCYERSVTSECKGKKDF